MKSKEFNQGYEAYANGTLKTSNPYPSGTTEYYSWLDGYNAACDDDIPYDEEYDGGFGDDFGDDSGYEYDEY